MTAAAILALQIHGAALVKPVREHRFHEKRRWRFDYAWPLEKVAVEVEGGIYVRGRHVRGKGYEKDLEKYNAAQELGWRVFRYSTGMIECGEAIRQIARVLDGPTARRPRRKR